MLDKRKIATHVIGLDSAIPTLQQQSKQNSSSLLMRLCRSIVIVIAMVRPNAYKEITTDSEQQDFNQNICK